MSLRASGLYHGLQAPLLPIPMAYVSDGWSLVVIYIAAGRLICLHC
jgi:hypothetical protein